MNKQNFDPVTKASEMFTNDASKNISEKATSNVQASEDALHNASKCSDEVFKERLTVTGKSNPDHSQGLSTVREIEHQQQQHLFHHQHQSTSNTNSLFSLDGIASRLLSERFFLTALELHSELVEAGRELPRLANFFSNPANFDLTAGAGPLPSASSLINISRSCSQTTLDSLEWGCGGSEEGGGGGGGVGGAEDRLHLLEFELRRAKETIVALRNNLTQATASPTTAVPSSAGSPSCSSSGLPSAAAAGPDSSSTHQWQGVGVVGQHGKLQPHQRATINFLVGEYLDLQGYKMAAITFAEEDGNQEFENWDEVGLNMPRPPSLAKLVCEPNVPTTTPPPATAVSNGKDNANTDEAYCGDTSTGKKQDNSNLETNLFGSKESCEKRDHRRDETDNGSNEAGYADDDQGEDTCLEGLREATYTASPVGGRNGEGSEELMGIQAQLELLQRRCALQERELSQLRPLTSTPSCTPFSSPLKPLATRGTFQQREQQDESQHLSEDYVPESIEDLIENRQQSDHENQFIDADVRIATHGLALKEADINDSATVVAGIHSHQEERARSLKMKSAAEFRGVSAYETNTDNRMYNNEDVSHSKVERNGYSDVKVDRPPPSLMTVDQFVSYYTTLIVEALRHVNVKHSSSSTAAVDGRKHVAVTVASCLCRCLLPPHTLASQVALSSIQQQLWRQRHHSSSNATAAAAAHMLPVLVTTLRNIAPNVILTKREELAPVLLLCLQHSESEEQRSELLSLLLWLSKRPDAGQRVTISTTLLLLMVEPAQRQNVFRVPQSASPEAGLTSQGVEPGSVVLGDGCAIQRKDISLQGEHLSSQNYNVNYNGLVNMRLDEDPCQISEGKSSHSGEYRNGEVPENKKEEAILVSYRLPAGELLPHCLRLLASKYLEQRLLGAQCITILAMHLATHLHISTSHAIKPDMLVDIILESLMEEKSPEVQDCLLSTLAFLLCLPLSAGHVEIALEVFVSSLEEYGWPYLNSKQLVDNKAAVVNKPSTEKVGVSMLQLNDDGRVDVYESGLVLLHLSLGQRYYTDHSITQLLSRLEKRLKELTCCGCNSGHNIHSIFKTNDNEDKINIASLVTAIARFLPYLLAELMSTAPSFECDYNDGNILENAAWMIKNINSITGLDDCRDKFSRLRQCLGQEWFKSWPLFDYLSKNLLPSLVQALDHFEATEQVIVQAFLRLFSDWCSCMGEAATMVHVGPLFHKLLLVEECDLEKIRDGSTSLTRAPLIVFVVSILGSQHQQQNQNQQALSNQLSDPTNSDEAVPLQDFLTRHINIVCLCGGSLEAVEQSVKWLLCLVNNCEGPLLALLWSCLVNKSTVVRAATGPLWTILAGAINDGSVLARRVVPALITLATDGEFNVRVAALRPLVLLAASTAAGEQVRSKCMVQLESLLEDSQLQQHQMLQLHLATVTADTAAAPAAAVTDKLLHNVLLPRLCSCAAVVCSSPGGGGAGAGGHHNSVGCQSIMSGFVTAYSAVLQRTAPQHIVAHFVLPPLQQLLSVSGEYKNDVSSLIREFGHLQQQQQPPRSSIVSATSGIEGATTTPRPSSLTHASGSDSVVGGLTPGRNDSVVAAAVVGGAGAAAAITSPVEDVKHRMSKMFSSGRQVAERANVNFPSLFKKK